MDTIGSTRAQIAGLGKEVLNKRLSAEVVLSAKSSFLVLCRSTLPATPADRLHLLSFPLRHLPRVSPRPSARTCDRSWLSRPDRWRAVTSPSPDGTISLHPCPHHVDGSHGTGRDALLLAGAGLGPDHSTGAVEEVQAAAGTNRAAKAARLAAIPAYRRNPLLGQFCSHAAQRHKGHDCRSARRLVETI
jgi:hypothetical protein